MTNAVTNADAVDAGKKAVVTIPAVVKTLDDAVTTDADTVDVASDPPATNVVDPVMAPRGKRVSVVNSGIKVGELPACDDEVVSIHQKHT